MAYLYVATTKAGKKVRGRLEAKTRTLAVRELRERKLNVVSLEPVHVTKEFYIGGVSTLQKVLFTKNLAVMLKAGVSIDDALEILAQQSKGRMRSMLTKVRQDVLAGGRMADAFATYPKTFNVYYVSMVRAGEESGTLADNLEQLAVRYSKDYEIMRKAQSALIYPALVLALTFGLGGLISLFVLPRLSTMFRAFDFQLPWTTRALIAMSEFLKDYGVAFVLITGGLTAFLIWLARQRFTAFFFHRLWITLPGVRSVSRPLNQARFALVFGSLMKSGLPITHALDITGSVLGNVMYKNALKQAAVRVERGEPLGDVLAEYKVFPLFVTRMVAIGEQTGKLEDVLFYIGEFYENELDTTLKNLSVIIEPVLLVAIGLIVAGVALSIITPIYNFIGAIG